MQPETLPAPYLNRLAASTWEFTRRYWRLVEQVCPDFRAAEKWLRIDGKALF